MSPEQYWDLSLRELWNVRRAERRQHRSERDRDLTLAWHIVAIRMKAESDKKLMSLEDYLHPVAKWHTAAQRRASLQALSETLGVKPGKRRRKVRVVRFDRAHGQ